MHSRYAFIIMMLASVACTVGAYTAGRIFYVQGFDGLGLRAPDAWISSAVWSMVAGIAANLLTAFTILFLNRRYNLLRSVSSLFAGLFLVFQSALPSLMGQFYDGTMLALIVVLAIIPLYNAFQRPDYTRSIYLVFCLLSFGALTDYCYAAYMAAFLIGCVQMRCLSMKVIVAIGLGLLTPPWILWGSGLADPTTLRLPVFASVFEALHTQQRALLLAYTAFNLFLGFAALCFNMIRIYGYNARSRAYNGFWIILAITTVALMALDYNHLMNYLPVLNLCVAVEVGFFFNVVNTRRSYFPIICLLIIYAGFYIWSIAS